MWCNMQFACAARPESIFFLLCSDWKFVKWVKGLRNKTHITSHRIGAFLQSFSCTKKCIWSKNAALNRYHFLLQRLSLRPKLTLTHNLTRRHLTCRVRSFVSFSVFFSIIFVFFTNWLVNLRMKNDEEETRRGETHKAKHFSSRPSHQLFFRHSLTNCVSALWFHEKICLDIAKMSLAQPYTHRMTF